MPDSEREKDLQKAVNDSGFPLQLGIESLAKQGAHKWHVVATEHPWIDPLTGQEKFADLVLRDKVFSSLIIECKRARETDWLFLRAPNANSQAHNDSRLVTRALVTAKLANGPVRINEWTDVPYRPGSPIVEYCVVRKDGARSQELLEKTASEIARAADAIAAQELDIATRHSLSLARIYTPVIVTTARLHICDSDYSQVDLETGEVRSAEVRPVPIVRFTKSFAAGAAQAAVAADTLESAAWAAERSVIIVRASEFMRFLNCWEEGELHGLMAQLLEAARSGKSR